MRLPITRYDEISESSTPLDPLEDAITWINSLRSRDYTLDVLKLAHGFPRNADTKRLVRSIKTYATHALGFLDQAYSGPSAVSFLPLYYVVLNLSKISVIASGQNADLDSQRWHGASYPSNLGTSQSILTDTVRLHDKGAFPLLYQALVGSPIGFTKRLIQMRDIYPYVSGVTYEYIQAFKSRPARQSLAFQIEQRGTNRYRLQVDLGVSRHPDAKKLRCLKAISGFRRVAGTKDRYVSSIVQANSEREAEDLLSIKVRRCLLYQPHISLMGDIQAVDIPVCGAQMLLPEELPIWIALFHLSNVVRYNPEFLDKVVDSKYWPVLLSLRKHSLLRYLMLFWSHLHQKTFLITVD